MKERINSRLNILKAELRKFNRLRKKGFSYVGDQQRNLTQIMIREASIKELKSLLKDE